jgi:methionine-S-sulfoxide reductase
MNRYCTALLVIGCTLFLAACERPSTASSPALEPSPSPQDAPTKSQGDVGLVAPDEKNRETVILAGGCFWGMEDILRDIDGVLETEVGYAGGGSRAPSYEDVKTGTTGHAECVRIVFDRGKIPFEELLEKSFFRMHDPTTKNRQGNDVGTQYRSAIFFTTEEQKATAERVIRKVNASAQWDAPVTTEVSAATEFTPAESYHQDYLEKNPGGYTCHYLREPIY